MNFELFDDSINQTNDETNDELSHNQLNTNQSNDLASDWEDDLSYEFNHDIKHLLHTMNAPIEPTGNVKFSLVTLLVKPDGEFKYVRTLFRSPRRFCGYCRPNDIRKQYEYSVNMDINDVITDINRGNNRSKRKNIRRRSIQTNSKSYPNSLSNHHNQFMISNDVWEVIG